MPEVIRTGKFKNDPESERNNAEMRRGQMIDRARERAEAKAKAREDAAKTKDKASVPKPEPKPEPATKGKGNDKGKSKGKGPTGQLGRPDPGKGKAKEKERREAMWERVPAHLTLGGKRDCGSLTYRLTTEQLGSCLICVRGSSVTVGQTQLARRKMQHGATRSISRLP